MLLISPTLEYPLTGTQPAQHGTKVTTVTAPPVIAEGYFKETASQTYIDGDLIYLDSNGTIAICTVATVGGVSQLNSQILGQPDSAATGVAGTTVGFQVIQPTSVYTMNVFHSTQASAVTTQAMLGTKRNIVKSAAGLWHVDITNAFANTVPSVTIVGFPQSGLDTNGNFINNAAVADVYGLVAVRFNPFYVTGAVTALNDALQLWC
jgi:hypothetical protein